MVEKGDLLEKEVPGKDYAEVFTCVCADNEVFVIGKTKFKPVTKYDYDKNGEEYSYIEYEVCDVSYENLRAFKNTEEQLKKNNLAILEKSCWEN